MDQNKKIKNLQNQIKINLSDILFMKVNNPKVKYFSINDVELTKDLLNAKIYVSYFNKEKEKIYFKEFVKVKGFLRSELAKRLEVRKVPNLEFVIDNLIDKIEEIDKLIEKSNDK